MLSDAFTEALTGAWGLAVMAALVVGDAFVVILPGEIAVSTMGALAVAHATPPLWLVIAVAALSAVAGDVMCYGIGRYVGTERWQWLRKEKVQRAQKWARRRLATGAAVVLFTARFIPFARLGINLVAGATRMPFSKYLVLVLLAATAWAGYQVGIGAVVAAVVPGGPVVAAIVTIVLAMGLGAAIDWIVRLVSRRFRVALPDDEEQAA